ncbi:hypothetical protein PHISP_01453 [Aspergillus sp. HF37]|nr:hypothetical protein PHISP_01453 [Aspergillus sp. HF37]
MYSGLLDFADIDSANARFSATDNIFRLVVNESANCTLEQYSWAIPPGFDTSNPKYQIGLFDATVDAGAFGNPLSGWIVWSPLFYVRKLMSDTTTATAATSSTLTTTPLTETGTGQPAPTPTPTATSSSSSSEGGSGASDATNVQIGVGVGVGVGGFLLVLLFGWFLLRRWKRARQSQPGITPPPPISTAPAELDVKEVGQEPAETKGRTVYELQGK